MNPCIHVTAANDDARPVLAAATKPLSSVTAATARALPRETLPIVACPVGNVFSASILPGHESAARHRRPRGSSNAGTPLLCLYGAQKRADTKRLPAVDVNNYSNCQLPEFVIASGRALFPFIGCHMQDTSRPADLHSGATCPRPGFCCLTQGVQSRAHPREALPEMPETPETSKMQQGLHP